MKELFDIDAYPSRTVMHCETKSDALAFCEYLDKIGRTWSTDESYLNKNYWERYKDKTCYNFNTGAYSDFGYYERHGFLILKSKNFIFKDEFETIDSQALTEFLDGFCK